MRALVKAQRKNEQDKLEDGNQKTAFGQTQISTGIENSE
jgi:hypothetical protein